ncbi:agmatine deiminase family protein [Candidatus Peregrinibacteria bacterium]|nr:agmatine deiminase family protein [Candidatus Peregrinibacteria bacterium]MBI3816477.1 agmatine deiminase family protein [Candidatus Peregrinibacteria bacterium]
MSLSPSSGTPGALGYRMPAEWEPHEATWLIWPHDERHWPGKFETVHSIWARMVKELETGEDVRILIHDDAVQRIAESHMESAGVSGERVHLHRFPSNFAWARDCGPIFLKNDRGEAVLTHWSYNAWGNHWEHNLDDHVPEAVAAITGLERVAVPMVLEGGSVDVNGRGALLTTENCLLNPNRNPDLSKEQIEERIRIYLGVAKVLWLRGDIAGDDTSGHIDALARFVNPSTIVTIIEEDPNDENHGSLQKNLEHLKTLTDQDGHPFEIIPLPLPKPVLWNGKRLPATYANFYIGNAVVLLPVFDDPNDAVAIEVLQKAFPDRRIAAINARDLIWGLGAFHCVTMQQPHATSHSKR